MLIRFLKKFVDNNQYCNLKMSLLKCKIILIDRKIELKKQKDIKRNQNYNFFKFLYYYYTINIYNKKIESQRKFYKILKNFSGLNLSSFFYFFNILGFSQNSFFYNLSKLEIQFFLNNFFFKFFLEDKIKFFLKNTLKLYLNLGNYKGKRLRQRLPMRGQRTKSNGKTCKKYLTMILFKRKEEKLSKKEKKKKKKI